MARSSRPWWRESVGQWYVWYEGKQHALGRDEAEAHRRWHLLLAGVMEGRLPEPERKPLATLSLKDLVKQYLADAEKRMQKDTYQVAQFFVTSFARSNGKLPATGIRKQFVEDWARKHSQSWSESTISLAKARIISLFNWAVEQELLPTNPIAKLKKPMPRSRGAIALISPEDHEKLMTAASPALRNVLFALHQTGCRPSEVLSVSSSEFFPEQGVWILRKHKNASKDKQRIVYLTPELTALCRDLAKANTQGPLFRTQSGKPWCHRVYLSQQLRELRIKLGIKRVFPYAYRHSFATDALSNGVPDAQVAELLGHSGTTMLHKHYAHLVARTQVLRKALENVR